MAAYRRVYDSRHLQTDCQEPRDQLRNPTLDNRLWATFLPFFAKLSATAAASDRRLTPRTLAVTIPHMLDLAMPPPSRKRRLALHLL